MLRAFLTVLFVSSTLIVNALAGTDRDTDTQLWSDIEFERGKEVTKEILKIGPPLLSKQKTVHIRPPFYKGKLPLTFAVREWGYPGMYVTFLMDFGKWRNEFIYLGLNKKNYVLANGARAKERVSGQVVAEAKLLGPFIETPKPVLIEEYHYGEDGRVIFKCKSYFNKDNGFKESETATWGKKVRDYFLIWPMGF